MLASVYVAKYQQSPILKGGLKIALVTFLLQTLNSDTWQDS